MERSLDLAVVVLVAGAGRRFGGEPGTKLLADLDGRPILAHVLDEIRALGPAATVVVLGHGARAVERTISWADETRVRNPAPERGLSSSLRVGIDALRELPIELGGAFIVLGDQPYLRVETMRALAAAATASTSAERLIVIPRYRAHEGPRNPVLLLHRAWSWVDAIDGDHGLAPIIAEHPEAILEVPVEGHMPDVDTRAELECLERLARP